MSKLSDLVLLLETAPPEDIENINLKINAYKMAIESVERSLDYANRVIELSDRIGDTVTSQSMTDYKNTKLTELDVVNI